MGAKAIILANPYTYKFLKGLTHSALAIAFLSIRGQLGALSTEVEEK